jgi:hypothetical protein
VKDINPKFFKAFEPNRAAHDPPALWIGTPPETENYFTEMSHEAKTNPAWAYFNLPTSSNPYIKRDWLEKTEAYYKRINDYETWLREYMAIFVKGGKRHLLPQVLNVPDRVELPKDLNKYTLYGIFDPASSSTFGVLFVVFNSYTKQIYVYDEIYEQTISEMSTRKIWARALEKVTALKAKGIKEVIYVYDEAAAWFRNEMSEIAQGVWLRPTQKASTDKEEGLALIKDVIDNNLLEIHKAQCPKFIWETENYIKLENGKIPKINDHLIDCFRYFLEAAGFKFERLTPPKDIDPLIEKRFHTIDEDFSYEGNLEEI